MSNSSVPEEGEYIIGRVSEVKDFGANLKILDYPDRKAFVHISEVASGWVKYIRDFIREGQMVVAKVTKVKKGSNVVDASVRQVSGHRKKEKIRAWRNEQKASKLLELVFKKSKDNQPEFQLEIESNLRDYYTSLYSAFETAVMDESGFRKKWEGSWVSHFVQMAIDNVTPPFVKIQGMFDLASHHSRGVEKIRNALSKPKAKNEDTDLSIISYGSPLYRISITAPDYKQAEDEMKSAVEDVLGTLKSEGGSGSFERI